MNDDLRVLMQYWMTESLQTITKHKAKQLHNRLLRADMWRLL